jgi:hypothetical protein
MAQGPQQSSISRSSIPEISANLDTVSSLPQYPRVYPTTSVVRPDAPTHDGYSGSDDDTTRASSPRNTPEPQRGQTDQQGHYVGNSSAVSFLIRIQKRLHQNSSLSHDSTIFTFGDASLQEFKNSFFLPPSKPDAQKLVEHYFNFAAPTHRFLHRPSIEKLVEEFYETGGEMSGREDGKAKSALLMVVFAQAQAYMPKGSMLKDNRYAVNAFNIVFTNDRQCPLFPQIRARAFRRAWCCTLSQCSSPTIAVLLSPDSVPHQPLLEPFWNAFASRPCDRLEPRKEMRSIYYCRSC